MSKRKKMVSLLLALVLCVGLLPVTVLAEPQEDSLTYVALGDSMSQGYMFIDYNETATEDPTTNHYCGWRGISERSYIKKFAEHLQTNVTQNVELIDLTIQGLQPDEVYAFLQPNRVEIQGEDLTLDGKSMTEGARKHIGWWVGNYHTEREQNPDLNGEGKYHIFDTFASMSDYYIDAITKADVITYDIGENFFGTYLTDARGEDEVFTDLVEDEKLEKQLGTFRTQLVSLLKENGLDSMISRLDGVLYAYASYIVYNKKCIDAIYELNPDVQVIVIPLSSPHQELYIQVDEENKVNYTTILDFVMESLNLYMRNYAKTLNAAGNNCTVAQLSGHVMSFADELYFYPDDLSEDAKALLGKTVLGYSGILGYDNYVVPDQIKDLYTTWEEFIAYLEVFKNGNLSSYKDPESGDVMVNALVFDHLVYDYIEKNYDAETAFNDFYGANFVDWFNDMVFQMMGAPSSGVTLDDGLMKDTMTVKSNPMYISTTIHDYNVERARAAIDSDGDDAKEWQKHLIEAIDALLDGWEKTCCKAATYRTFPVESLAGGMMPSAGDFGVADLLRVLQDPDSATDKDYLALHAALRSGSAARGFGSHPCPRGLDVKYRAVLAAYYNDSAELELAEEYKGEILELADQIGKLIKKYGPDAIEAIEKKLATPEQIDTVHNLLDAISKSSNKFEQFALSVKLATELYQIADQNELVPEKIVKTIENTKQALAMMQDVGKKVAVGAAVGTAAAAGVSVARYVIEKKQAAKEAAVAKEAAAEAKAVQSAARINTVGGVQQWLNDNYNAGLTVDGGYGNMTKQAIVKALQKELGFTASDVDGVAGQKTLSALPELKKGSQGRTVELLQCLLVSNGYNSTYIGNIFGNDAEQSVKALQNAQGLAQTGVCDSQVWKALLG